MMQATEHKAVGSNRLPILASTINSHLTEAEAAMRAGLSTPLLIEAKELVRLSDGHGEWLPRLQANCQLGPRQAQTYMRLARPMEAGRALSYLSFGRSGFTAYDTNGPL
jgi:hypothetical protein